MKRVATFSRLAFEDTHMVPDLFVQYPALVKNEQVRRVPGGWIYEGGFYPDYLTVGGASHTIAPKALEWCTGSGIDIGAGLWPLPGATPVDIWRGPGVSTLISEVPPASVDFVFSSHCLEHIANWEDALATWTSKLRPGGTLFLYLPHPDCAMWRPGSAFVGDEHKWAPTPELIRTAMLELGLSIVAEHEGPDTMQSFFVCARSGASA
jgi:SAM-dependent methyltransferase